MSVVGEFAAGVATLGRGVGLMIKRPRLFLLGAVPPLVTSVLFVVALVSVISNLDSLVAVITAFADDWSGWLRQSVQVIVGVALVGGAVLIMVVTFSAITLALGSPLYDKIAELTEAELGAAPEPVEESVLAGVGRALRQALALLALSVLGSVVFFAAGFIPVVGQTVVPVLSACFGGWLLCLELLGAAFDRRGRRTLAARHRAMAGRRARVLGFAVPSFLLVAIPFVSVFVFPAATIGATMLARRLLASAAPPRRPDRGNLAAS